MKKLIDKVLDVLDVVFDIATWVLIMGGFAGVVYFGIRVLIG